MKELLEEMVVDLKKAKKIADKKEKKNGRIWGFALASNIFFTAYNIVFDNYSIFVVNILGLLLCFIGISRHRYHTVKPCYMLQECIDKVEKDLAELVEREKDPKFTNTQ
ncbi:hypothetical protein [Bacillus cereus]|uniref:hypothetical protein n=1 Tax=Bacillus cereus TaxID=1396 RepID=UPI000B4BE086|nr:hypothetical protein [Bacillus cereus]